MTTPTPVPAYLTPERCVAYFLAYDSDLPDRFRYDAPVNVWRTCEGDRWVPLPGSGLGVVIEAAVPAIDAALAATDIPLVFRALFADDEREATRLTAVTDWQAERERRWEAWYVTESDRYFWWKDTRERWEEHQAAVDAARRTGQPTPLRPTGVPVYAPDPFLEKPPPADSLISDRQRAKLRSRCPSDRTARAALMQACHMQPFAYASAVAPIEADPRAWLGALPRVSGAAVRTSALYATYCEALPDGARRLDSRRFHTLAREVLGEHVRSLPPGYIRPEGDTRGTRYYLDIHIAQQPDDGDSERPHLYAVS